MAIQVVEEKQEMLLIEVTPVGKSTTDQELPPFEVTKAAPTLVSCGPATLPTAMQAPLGGHSMLPMPSPFGSEWLTHVAPSFSEIAMEIACVVSTSVTTAHVVPPSAHERAYGVPPPAGRATAVHSAPPFVVTSTPVWVVATQSLVDEHETSEVTSGEMSDQEVPPSVVPKMPEPVAKHTAAEGQ